MTRSQSAALPLAALPVAHVLLRILILLNWLMGAVIIVLLVAMPTRRWIMSALDLTPSLEADRLVMGLRIIAIVGLATIPLNHIVLQRLLAMVRTVRAGEAFVAANAARLKAIGWALLALQIVGIVIGGIAKSVSTAAHPLHLNAGFSATGWLAVLLAFILSSVFAEGAAMRDDLEGTV